MIFIFSPRGGITILWIVVISTILVKSAQVFSVRVFQSVQKCRVKSDEEFRKRMDTLGSIVRYVLTIGILVVAVVMIMDELGIEIGPLLAASGVLCLAIGFGCHHQCEDHHETHQTIAGGARIQQKA